MRATRVRITPWLQTLTPLDYSVSASGGQGIPEELKETLSHTRGRSSKKTGRTLLGMPTDKN
jgi:hypothetical protein